MRKLKGTFLDGGAIVLFIFTLLGGISFAASGGHKAVEEKGFVEAVKTANDERVDTVSTQALYKRNVNQ